MLASLELMLQIMLSRQQQDRDLYCILSLSLANRRGSLGAVILILMVLKLLMAFKAFTSSLAKLRTQEIGRCIKISMHKRAKLSLFFVFWTQSY